MVVTALGRSHRGQRWHLNRHLTVLAAQYLCNSNVKPLGTLPSQQHDGFWNAQRRANCFRAHPQRVVLCCFPIYCRLTAVQFWRSPHQTKRPLMGFKWLIKERYHFSAFPRCGAVVMQSDDHTRSSNSGMLHAIKSSSSSSSGCGQTVEGHRQLPS